MRVLIASALVLGAAGCNQLFGLEPPASGGGDGAIDGPGSDGDPGDAPDDGPRPGDGDGDGVLDLTDNCPTAWNPAQADEDGDAAISGGDACDLCPHLASGGGPHADLDGDGVGDACDPRSDIAHCLEWFDGFSEGTAAEILARYTITGGQWVFELGQARQRDALEPSTRLVTVRPFTAARVTAGGVLDELLLDAALSPYRNLVGPLVQATDAASGTCLGSLARRVQGGVPLEPTTVFSRQVPPEPGMITNEGTFPMSTAMGAGVAFTVELDLTNPTMRSATATLPGAAVQVPGSAVCVDGVAGVRTSYTAASYDYLLVITVRGPGACAPRGP